MEYSTSDATVVHGPTGHRMHQEHLPVPSAVSAKDINMLIWSLMAVLEAAGVSSAAFDPDDPSTYGRLAEAIQVLAGGGGGGGAFANTVVGLDASEMVNGQAILALGRNTPGDGGGGVFVYAAGSTATVDNVVVFAPAVGPGRLRREGWTTHGFTREVQAAYAGVFGNGSDESSAIQGAWDAGYVLRAAPGRNYVAKGLIAKQYTGMVCSGGRAKISVPAGSNMWGVKIGVSDFTWDGVDISGGNLGPWSVIGAAMGTRDGMVIGGPGLQLANLTLVNFDVYGFDRYGVDGQEVVSSFSFGKRSTLWNINAHHNYQSWSLRTGFEYVILSQCYGYESYIGIAKAAGNVSIDSCHFENNWYNSMVNGGLNNSHGSWTNCSFNHAKFIGLKCNGVEYGESFTGCRLWYAPIMLENCTGVSIRNSQIGGGSPEVVIDGGGINSIDDNYTPGGLTKTFIGLTFTSFRRNRTTAADTSPKSFYGDVAMRSTAALGYAYPIAWNAVVDTFLPLNYGLKKWHGEDASFLELSGAFSVPRTGYYHFDITLVFDTKASAEKVTLRLSRFAGGGSTRTESILARAEFAATRTGCCLTISRRLLCYSGDGVRVELSGISAAGIEIQTGGIDVQIRSDD